MTVDVFQSQVTVSSGQTNAMSGDRMHLFGDQKVSVIRIDRTLPTVVKPIVLVHLTLWVTVLELKHDVRETVDRVELFRSVPTDRVEVHVGANSSWGIRTLVEFLCGTGWK